MAVALLVPAALLAIADWLTVARVGGSHPVRWLTKLAPVALCAVVAATEGSGVLRGWVVAGLFLSLAGDAALLLPDRWFVAGLGAFLAAHVVYALGMLRLDLSASGLVAGVVLVAAGMATIGRRILGGAQRAERALGAPVAAYLVVISAMVVIATGSAEPWLIVAALLFYASDAMLGWNRFVAPAPVLPVAVMVTYHLAQAGFAVQTLAG